MSHLFSVPMNEKPSMPMREALAVLICQTLAKRLKRPVEGITLQTRFEELEMDSLDLAEMFFLLEDELQATVPLERGVHLESVSDVLELIVLCLPETQLENIAQSLPK